jgi:hypothetical protein
MTLNPKVRCLMRLAASTALTFGLAARAAAQVSPDEIVNPELKALEQTYFPQLLTLHRQIGAAKFPFSFVLSRYVGLDPDKQDGADSRGLEFVRFHERIILKVTGNYNAAYNTNLLTQNERASRTFQDVLVPVLRMIAAGIPQDVSCEAIGFEIAHHARSRRQNSDYEGKEILVVLFERDDFFALAATSTDAERQEFVNRAEVYVSGQRFGLALGKKDPIDLEALARSARPGSAGAPQSASRENGTGSAARKSPGNLNLGGNLRAYPGGSQAASRSAPIGGTQVAPVQPAPAPDAPAPPAATPADAERLQAKYQAQLDALVKKGAAQLHLVDYAPPSFAVFQNRIVLQFTLRNPQHFEKDASSIYRRAAQSFDLFLALELKELLDQIPQDSEIAALDITVLNQLAAAPKPASEAVEFVLPLKPLRQFVDAEITNQDLINQSVVLVNGVRIALNLQLVE